MEHVLSFSLYRAAFNRLPGQGNMGPCKAQIAWRRQPDNKCPSCSVIHTDACEADACSSVSWCMYSRAQHTTLLRHTKQLTNITHTRRPHATQTHTKQNRCWEHWPPCATAQWLLWNTSLTLAFIAPTLLVIQTLICMSQLLLLLRFVLMQKLPHFLLYRGLGFLSFGGFFFLNPTSTCWVSKVQTHSTFTLPQRTWSSNEYVHSNIRHEVSSSKGKRKLFQNPAFLHHLCQQLSFFLLFLRCFFCN